jgi:hypothetical protein
VIFIYSYEILLRNQKQFYISYFLLPLPALFSLLLNFDDWCVAMLTIGCYLKKLKEERVADDCSNM